MTLETKKGLSQEALKLIACITMLLDHIGATLVTRSLQSVPMQEEIVDVVLGIYYALRIIGRIAFPIYCFLLVEGAYHTRDPKKYGLRLFVGMLLSEVPFDLAFSFRGRVCFDWMSNSVMMTLLLGFCMIEAMKRLEGFRKIIVILPFYIAAELLHTDYGGLGILIIALFALTRGMDREKLVRGIGFCLLVYPGSRTMIGGLAVNLEWFAVLSLIPIFYYDGRKLTHNKAVQWGFYLFYPVHIGLLALLEVLIFG